MKLAQLSLALAIAASACSSQEAAPPVDQKRAEPIAVATASVVAEEWAEPIVGTGTVAASKTTDIGPLVSRRQRDRVEGYIEVGKRDGARAVTGGGRPSGMRRGWVVEPTGFADVDNSMVIAQEEIEATDDELTTEIERVAERFGEKPAQVRKDLERRGVLEAVRSDIARSKALQFLVDHAEVVDANGNPVDLTLPEPSATPPPDTIPADGEVAAEESEEEPES